MAESKMAETLLEIDGIETCYGLSQVLFGLSLKIHSGEMVALMGRNGMGKTTTIRSIMGMTPARAGKVRFAGEDVRSLPWHERRAPLVYVRHDSEEPESPLHPDHPGNRLKPYLRAEPDVLVTKQVTSARSCGFVPFWR